MGNRRKLLRAKKRNIQNMHPSPNQPDPSHAVIDTPWGRTRTAVFAEVGQVIQASTPPFEVTDEPVLEAAQPMPADIAAEYQQLVKLAELASPAAVARLEMLADRHPEAAVLNNLLAAAYSRQGRMREALSVVEKNYRLAPDYLFARIQYAQLCLVAGRWDAVPEIFDGHFDLKLLYPHRTRYHRSEYVGFTAVAAEYYLLKGDRAMAEKFYSTLQTVAPDHELTKRLKQLMGDGE